MINKNPSHMKKNHCESKVQNSSTKAWSAKSLNDFPGTCGGVYEGLGPNPQVVFVNVYPSKLRKWQLNNICEIYMNLWSTVWTFWCRIPILGLNVSQKSHGFRVPDRLRKTVMKCYLHHLPRHPPTQKKLEHTHTHTKKKQTKKHWRTVNQLM